MKTKIKKTIALLIILSGGFCISVLKAQISYPYPVDNQTTCDIVIDYEIGDAGSCPNSLCETGQVTVPAGQTIYIGYSCGTHLVDVHIVIHSIGGDLMSGSYNVGDMNSSCIISQGNTYNNTGGSCWTSINMKYQTTGTSFW